MQDRIKTAIGRIDVLSAEYIKEELEKLKISIPVRVVAEIDSTNDEMKRMVNQGETRDFLLIANQQTGGRGTKGRAFFSPDTSGIYMSLLLHPDATVLECMKLTIMAATAQALAMEELLNRPVQIKWVNDVWLDRKKVCGILTEVTNVDAQGKAEGVIIGIGINMYEPEEGFPKEISTVAGSVLGSSSQRKNARNEMIITWIKKLFSFYQCFPEDSFRDEYIERCFIIGNHVRLLPVRKDLPLQNNLEINEDVEVLGIDEAYRLKVKSGDGQISYVSNREVSVHDAQSAWKNMFINAVD